MQIYKVYDKVFRCEFQLYIGELEEFKKGNPEHGGISGRRSDCSGSRIYD